VASNLAGENDSVGAYRNSSRRLLPGLILTTEQIGRAMLTAARQGAPKRVLESRDIRALAPMG